jgi:hypothetical protein
MRWRDEQTKEPPPAEGNHSRHLQAERANIFVIGKLLLEAKEQAGHGTWLRYLKSIGWSDRNAQLHMSVARLAAKYETVADLNAAPTALYQLAWLEEDQEKKVKDLAEDKSDDDEVARCVRGAIELDTAVLPLAIERLRASVARGDNAEQQRQAVVLTSMAQLNPGIGDVALEGASKAINHNCFGDTARYKSMEDQAQAILKANPKTKEELKAIIDKHPILMPGGKVKQDDLAIDDSGVIIDDGSDAYKDLEAQACEAREAAERDVTVTVERFDEACDALLELAATPSEVLTVSTIDEGDLDMLGNFLKQVAASKRKRAAPDLDIPECLRREVA